MMKQTKMYLQLSLALLSFCFVPAESRETILSAGSAKALQSVFQHMQRKHFPVGAYAYHIIEKSTHVEIYAIAPTAVKHPEYARGGLFYSVSKHTSRIVKFDSGK